MWEMSDYIGIAVSVVMIVFSIIYTMKFEIDQINKVKKNNEKEEGEKEEKKYNSKKEMEMQ